MSIFSAIKNAIFGADSAPAATPTRTASAPTPQTSAPRSATPPATPTAAAPPAAMKSVDVEAVVEQYAQRSGQKLNWRTSIVDLLKALGLDSSLDSRKKLAEELGFDGDNSDSATMNVWLHKRVMQKLAENGGKVPDSILNK